MVGRLPDHKPQMESRFGVRLPLLLGLERVDSRTLKLHSVHSRIRSEPTAVPQGPEAQEQIDFVFQKTAPAQVS